MKQRWRSTTVYVDGVSREDIDEISDSDEEYKPLEYKIVVN